MYMYLSSPGSKFYEDECQGGWRGLAGPIRHSDETGEGAHILFVWRHIRRGKEGLICHSNETGLYNKTLMPSSLKTTYLHTANGSVFLLG